MLFMGSFVESLLRLLQRRLLPDVYARIHGRRGCGVGGNGAYGSSTAR